MDAQGLFNRRVAFATRAAITAFWNEDNSVPVAKAVTPIGRQEKPCNVPTCKRMNDIGVKSCWHCGVMNPTS